MGWEWVPAHFPFPHPYVVFRVLNLTVFSISFSLSHSSEGNDLHRICEGNDLHWICEGNDLAAAISVGVTTVVLRRGRLVKRAYDALLLDAGGTLLQLVKPVEETYASIGRKYVGVSLMTSDPCSNLTGGLIISNTETIRSFLITASNDPLLSLDLRKTASDLSVQPSMPYKSLRSVWFASLPSTRPDLLCLFSGSDFVFTSPKPREKSEELKARLRKLEEVAERKAYQELVKDITPRKETDEPFSSYKDQLGFGLHVALTMFTGYLVGYAAFRALFSHSPVMNAAGGILGLVCAMLLETLLFIIRTSNQDLRSSSSTSKLKKDQ